MGMRKSRIGPHARSARARPSSARSAPPAAPRRRMPEQRPGRILSAALETFVENGFAATRLEDGGDFARPPVIAGTSLGSS